MQVEAEYGPIFGQIGFSSRLFESVSSNKLKKDLNLKKPKVSGELLRYSNCRKRY